jgi:RNA polymerase sigma-70 factor (ECF subfamily)
MAGIHHNDLEHGDREPVGLEALVAEARRGDRAAFDELVRRTYVDTYTLAARLTGDEEDARDVVQEAYLRAWKGIRRFRGDAAFTTWMYRITANASYTMVERRRRRRTLRLDDVDDPIDRRLDAQPDTLAESSAGLDELSAALDQLPATLRTVVILKDVYGLSHEAIGDDIGISVAAAKVRLHRGRKRLRDLLDAAETDDGLSGQGRSARAV